MREKKKFPLYLTGSGFEIRVSQTRTIISPYFKRKS
jgi:hypothetical protein